MTSKIPGLKSIDVDDDNRITFEVEDDRVDEFFAYFGLESGDVAGLSGIVTESLQHMIESPPRPTMID